MKALILALIIHLTVNPLVFLKGRNVFETNRTLKVMWSAVFIFEFLLFVSSLLFFRYLPDGIVHFGRLLGTSWMLFLLYVGGIVLIFDIFYLIFKRKLHKPLHIRHQPKRMKQSVLTITVLIVTVVLVHGKYKFEHPVVTHHSITIDKDGGYFDSLKIVVVGDMHLGYTINRDDARRMVDLIMAQKADLILMVGDLIDASILPLMRENIAMELTRLSAPLGVYSCPGNHEYRNEHREKIEFLETVGIRMLNDSAVLVDSSFYVVGREDFIVPNRLPLRDILAKHLIDRSKPIFVLNHTPNNLREESDAGADLALYGHTHHGQAFPGNIATEIKFELAYGFKKKGNTHFYVTSGLGLAGPQHRICTVSEIALFEVKFKQQDALKTPR